MKKNIRPGQFWWAQDVHNKTARPTIGLIVGRADLFEFHACGEEFSSRISDWRLLAPIEMPADMRATAERRIKRAKAAEERAAAAYEAEMQKRARNARYRERKQRQEFGEFKDWCDRWNAAADASFRGM